MSRAKIEVTGATAEEISKLLRKDEKYMIGVRLYAVYQIAQGAVSRDLEKIYNVSFKSVYNWVHNFNQNGIEGLKDKAKQGRTPRLNDDERQILKNVITSEEPTAYHYNTSTWTGPIVMDFIKKKFGVIYKKAQIYNILKSLGLSYQKAKGKYPEADKEKREVYINDLKKTKN